MYKQTEHLAFYDCPSTSYPVGGPSSQMETNLISFSSTEDCNPSPCFWLTIHRTFILLKME